MGMNILFFMVGALLAFDCIVLYILKKDKK